MIATKIEMTVQNDGELHLTQLPCRKGDRVEAIILVLENGVDDAEAERKREEAEAIQCSGRCVHVSLNRTVPHSRRIA